MKMGKNPPVSLKQAFVTNMYQTSDTNRTIPTQNIVNPTKQQIIKPLTSYI